MSTLTYPHAQDLHDNYLNNDNYLTNDNYHRSDDYIRLDHFSNSIIPPQATSEIDEQLPSYMLVDTYTTVHNSFTLPPVHTYTSPSSGSSTLTFTLDPATNAICSSSPYTLDTYTTGCYITPQGGRGRSLHRTIPPTYDGLPASKHLIGVITYTPNDFYQLCITLRCPLPSSSTPSTSVSSSSSQHSVPQTQQQKQKPRKYTGRIHIGKSPFGTWRALYEKPSTDGPMNAILFTKQQNLTELLSYSTRKNEWRNKVTGKAVATEVQTRNGPSLHVVGYHQHITGNVSHKDEEEEEIDILVACWYARQMWLGVRRDYS